MKHEKEWRTCDRCGSEIKIKPVDQMRFTRYGDYSTPSPIFEEGFIRGEIHTCKLFLDKDMICVRNAGKNLSGL